MGVLVYGVGWTAIHKLRKARKRVRRGGNPRKSRVVGSAIREAVARSTGSVVGAQVHRTMHAMNFIHWVMKKLRVTVKFNL